MSMKIIFGLVFIVIGYANLFGQKVFKYYYSNGNLKNEIVVNQFGNTVRESLYHENGQLWDEKKYDEEYNLTSWIGFKEDGQMILKEEYENGKLKYAVSYYYSEGGISSERKYIANKNVIHSILYTKQGLISQEDYYNADTLDNVGVSKNYYNNSNQLLSIGEYDNHGNKVNIWKMFYEDGTLMQIRDYTEKESVLIQFFDENGQLLEEGRRSRKYEDTEKKVGIWKLYNESGELYLSEDYSENLNSFKRQYYYSNGIIEKEGRVKKEDAYSMEKEYGLWRYYDKKGRLVKEEKI